MLLFCVDFTSVCIIPASSIDVPQWFIVQEVAAYCECFQGCRDACVLTPKNPHSE